MTRLRDMTPVKDAATRLNAAIDAIEQVVLGRSDILRQLKYALVTKQHLFMNGQPGIAKSMLADLTFGKMEGATNYFSLKCTKKMSEDYIVGPPDMRRFRKEGRLIHMTDGSMVESDFAFLDEFLDLSSGASRACLELLNERTFTRGIQQCTSPLWTAIAATNFDGGDDEALEAVLDRFIFKATVEPLQSDAQRKKMLENRIKGLPDLPPINKRDIVILNTAMKTVIVPELVLDTYLELVGKIQQNQKISDRTLAVASDVIRANAVLRGARVASVVDLTALDTVFAPPGDSQAAAVWGKAFKLYNGAKEREERGICVSLAHRRVSALRMMAEECTTYDEIYPFAIEGREAQQLLDVYRTKSSSGIVSEAMSLIAEINDMADTLYSTK